MKFHSFNAPDPNAPNRPLVTVFCAVWHKQPNKLELLRSHWANLKAQSIPVEPCYIFDNGDQAPDWLEAPWYSFDEPLTIYEAWSAATALSHTRYIMNLNMDDRLATNAVQTLVATADATNSTLVGGEWLVNFDESHLEQKFGVEDLWETGFSADWPPRKQANLRLGSGTAERGTYGRRHFGTWSRWGSGIQAISAINHRSNRSETSIFWQMLADKNCKFTRIPMIIGRYYSEEGSQAEFRPHKDNDHLRAHGISLISFANFVLSGDYSKWPGLNPEAVAPEAGPRNRIEQASDKLAAQFRAMGLGAQCAPQMASMQ
ncbi:glycosyltransferase family A protein [Phaeobacter piscinae]|uniref:glycosyltransferase family A protein n=1 Tax=Phaeobacter piscinae TaxID=1580596 RepID=UPI0039F70043